jgi:hypothetical protein
MVIINLFPLFLKALKIKCSNQPERQILEKQLPGKSTPVSAVNEPVKQDAGKHRES